MARKWIQGTLDVCGHKIDLHIQGDFYFEMLDGIKDQLTREVVKRVMAQNEMAASGRMSAYEFTAEDLGMSTETVRRNAKGAI